MKKVYLIIAVVMIFTACSSDSVSIQDCQQKGQKVKLEKKLNYRTGKYELKSFCS